MPPRADAESQSFRTKKWQTISGHLKAIMHSKGVQKMMIEHPVMFEEVVAFLQLFVGMAPQVRAVDTHIEYESDSWIRALGVTMDLSRLTAIVGQGWQGAGTNDLLYVLDLLSRRIRDIALLRLTPLDPTRFAPPDMDVSRCLGISHVVIKFDVGYGWVSIHNPLHYLYGELLKHAPRVVDTDKVRWTVYEDDAAVNDVLFLVEYPLRSESGVLAWVCGDPQLTLVATRFRHSHHVSRPGPSRDVGAQRHRDAGSAASLPRAPVAGDDVRPRPDGPAVRLHRHRPFHHARFHH
jgi:hypothetical protein